MYSFVGYQVILAEYFPAPHLDRSAPGQSRTSSPALHTKTSDQTQMPWRQVAAVPLSLSMYTHIYIYRASMQFSVNIPECVVECNLTYV